MRSILKAVLIAVCLTGVSSVCARPFTMDLQGGFVNHASELSKFNLNVFGHWWFPIDQMFFVGIGSGYQEIDNESLVPISASFWTRLPVGSHVMPVMLADWGYLIGKYHQMFWRAAGGADIKCGDHSSILAMAGYQFLDNFGKGYVFLQVGMLVEI
ncbi:MAG: hypothetical protein MJY85_10845 [Fibrobacter sp.]|nr:hypothetical protein [Fibrobacter sp.]